MIRKLLAVDGVEAICHFRDDGAFVEGYGLMDEDGMIRLAHFAHEYKRIVQGHADQLSMFTQVRGWTPPGGWVVHGAQMSVCSIGNLVCLFNPTEGNLTEVMREMQDVSQWS